MISWRQFPNVAILGNQNEIRGFHCFCHFIGGGGKKENRCYYTYTKVPQTIYVNEYDTNCQQTYENQCQTTYSTRKMMPFLMCHKVAWLTIVALFPLQNTKPSTSSNAAQITNRIAKRFTKLFMSSNVIPSKNVRLPMTLHIKRSMKIHAAPLMTISARRSTSRNATQSECFLDLFIRRFSMVFLFLK